MYGTTEARMNPGDQQFISFQDFPETNVAGSQQVHVDLGTPNQQLFGHMQTDGSAMMQDLQGFPGQKDGELLRFPYSLVTEMLLDLWLWSIVKVVWDVVLKIWGSS